MYRALKYRLLVDNKSNSEYLQELLDACNNLWNLLLEENIRDMREWQRGERETKPSVLFFSLNHRVVQLRSGNYYSKYPSVPLKGVSKRFSSAWSKKFKTFSGSTKGFPKFKKKTNSFELNEHINVRHSLEQSTVKIPGIKKRLIIKRNGPDKYRSPKLGLDETVKRIVVKKGIGHKWYVILFYRIPDEIIKNDTVIGIDRNVKNITTSEGTVYLHPDLSKLDKNIRKKHEKLSRQVRGSNNYQKTILQLNKIYKKKNNKLRDFVHQVSNNEKHNDIVLEDLNTQEMRSITGKNSRKLRASLNNSPWYMLEEYLSYKTNVEFINPAYTSQQCSNCNMIEKSNRKSQSLYKCSGCGIEINADLNAAINIYSARGIGSMRYLRYLRMSACHVKDIMH